jgi:hypothetical protein
MLIEDVEALWQPIAETDDWTAFYRKLDAIRSMRDAYQSKATEALTLTNEDGP